MKYDVITIGSAVKDVYVNSAKFIVEKHKTSEKACFILGDKIEIEEPTFSTGGGATNAAATFAHLGLKVACIAKIAKDQTGESIKTDLHKHGVYTNLIVESKTGSSGYSTLLTTASGQRTAIIYRGVSKELKAKEINWKQIKTKWFYITSLGGDLNLLKKIINFAIKNDIKIAWNPGSEEIKQGITKIKPFLKQIEVISLNKEEAAKLTRLEQSDLKAILAKLSRMTARTLVITDGENGTYAIKNNDCFKANPTPVEPINTTGSGDALGSAFTTGMIEYEENVILSLQLGTLNAESVIQKIGAKNGILNRMPGARRLSKIKISQIKF